MNCVEMEIQTLWHEWDREQFLALFGFYSHLRTTNRQQQRRRNRNVINRFVLNTFLPTFNHIHSDIGAWARTHLRQTTLISEKISFFFLWKTEWEEGEEVEASFVISHNCQLVANYMRTQRKKNIRNRHRKDKEKNVEKLRMRLRNPPNPWNEIVLALRASAYKFD